MPKTAPPTAKIPAAPAFGPAVVEPEKKVLLAHSDKATLERFASVFKKSGCRVLTAADGITAMVKAMNEQPSAAFIDVSLPKISGFDIAKRLKTGKETMKVKTFLITSSKEDESKKKGLASAYGAVDYIDEGISQESLDEVLASISGKETEAVKEEISVEKISEKPVAPRTEIPGAPAVAPKGDPDVERARRLVRAMLSDIELYSPQKVQEAIISGNYREAFEKDLKDGLKHYENRISAQIRQKADFFNEEINKYIEKKKNAIKQ